MYDTHSAVEDDLEAWLDDQLAEPVPLDVLGGWQLADVLRELGPHAGVDHAELIERLKAYERLERFVAARKARVLADFGRRRFDVRGQFSHDGAPGTTWAGQVERSVADDIDGDSARNAALEVAFALGLTRQGAQAELLDACTLEDRLPEAMSALETGRISRRAATTLNEQTLTLTPELARGAVRRVLARPGARTVPQIRAAIRAAAIAADPATARRREVAAVRSRTLDAPRVLEDGMGYLVGYLPAAELVPTYERLSRWAEATAFPGDTRSAGARRADVLVDLVAGRPLLTPDGRDLREGAGVAPARPRTWRTDVVVAATTLQGQNDKPGHLVGYGPVTAQTARQLASGQPAGVGDNGAGVIGDPQWRRILTDPVSGITLDYGTTRYRPPDSLADFVRARDGRCSSPVCTMPAHRCDLDHVKSSPAGPSPRPDPGGTTSAQNLMATCRSDHRTKSAPGWRVETPSPGTSVWTTPTGHEYVRHAEPPLDDGGSDYGTGSDIRADESDLPPPF